VSHVVNEPLLFDLAGGISSCPTSVSDTMRISVIMEQETNLAATFEDFSGGERLLVELVANDNYAMEFKAVDQEDNIISMSLSPSGNASLSSLNVDFSTILTDVGVTGNLQWNPACGLYDPEQSNTYELFLIINDHDVCNKPGDTLFIDLELSENSRPLFNPDANDKLIEVAIGETYSELFEATDIEGDALSMTVINLDADGASLEELGVALFTRNDIAGEISGQLEITPDCNLFDFKERDQFDLALVFDDEDPCSKPGDTLYINLEVDNINECIVTSVNEQVVNSL